MEIDHIGIAVADLDRTIKTYTEHFGFREILREDVPAQKTRAVFLQSQDGRTTIELLTPLGADGATGPIGKFLDKRGPGQHHICYRVADIRAELKRLSAAGIVLIDHEVRHGARQSQIAFLHPKSCAGVLTELCQRPE